MNKTLLLILCDFLLLNLLALTRWDKNDLPPPPLPLASQPTSAREDVVAALRLTLEEERANREKLARDLTSTQAESTTRATILDQARARTTELSERLQKKEQESLRLTQQAGLEAERARAALESARAEAITLRQAEEKLKTETATLRSQIASANLVARSAEERSRFTEATLRTAEDEKKKLLEQNQSLSKGVTQLAEKNGEITKEIREYRPVAPNALYADFLARRATVLLLAERPSAQSSSPRRRESKSVLLTDGSRTVALIPLSQTPFTLGDAQGTWSSLSGTLTLPPPSNFPQPIPSLYALKQGDPRLLLAPVDPSETNRIASSTYRLATDPFRFSKSLLVHPNGESYGECTFRLAPNLPGYLEMDSRFLNRLQGEYAPSSGDWVLTLGGEFLGIMVNDRICALVTSLEPGLPLPLNPKGAERTVGETLSSLKRATASLDSILR
ncbi:MAG: hypothetical protein ACEQSM_02430 [Aliarcobacter sp.]